MNTRNGFVNRPSRPNTRAIACPTCAETCVAQLVQDDAGEQGKDERDAVERRRAAARKPVGDPDPRKEQQEGGVHIEADAGHRSQFPRPFHRAAEPPGASVVLGAAPYSLPLEIAVRRTSRKQLRGESLS